MSDTQTLEKHDKHITELFEKCNKIERQVAVDITELKGFVGSINVTLESMSKSIEEYVKFAKDTYVTKGELDVLKADGKYAKLWNGLVGVGIGVIISCIITAILWQNNGLVSLIVKHYS